MNTGVRFSHAELVDLTDYEQPARQLAELHKQGFWRARISPRTGRVVLERAHYVAVCAGQGSAPEHTPKPRPITIKRRAGVRREAEPRTT